MWLCLTVAVVCSCGVECGCGCASLLLCSVAVERCVDVVVPHCCCGL